MRTEHNWTPRQMFIQGLLELEFDGKHHPELDQVYYNVLFLHLFTFCLIVFY